jgi:hypothetical protein
MPLVLANLLFVAPDRAREAATGDDKAADGPAIIRDHCLRCHDQSVIHAARHTTEEWDATLKRMGDKGAFLSPEEFETLKDYLAMARAD